MQIEIRPSNTTLSPDFVLVVPVFSEDDPQQIARQLGIASQRIKGLIERGEVKGKLYHTALLHGEQEPSLLFVGAGKSQDFDGFYLARVAATASRFATGRGYTALGFRLRGPVVGKRGGQAVTAGVIRGAYDPGLLKTRDRTLRAVQRLTILADDQHSELEQGARVGEIEGEANTIARDLVNLPPNELTPSILAGKAQALAKQYGLDCEVLDEDAMRAQGMGAILGVSQGSTEPARFIILRYGSGNSGDKLAVCGKGLTFDSGGLSLKTGEGMMTMKSDMGGAAAVLGGLVAVARLNPDHVQVTGYIGATENMPGGGAMRPGDVLRASNGETIEVLNTDAEGRLVLADVLTYAVKEGNTHLLDFATLTGAATVALGRGATLTTGNRTDWVHEVVQAAEEGLERAWSMPLYREYREAMNSEVADIKNISGGRMAGALTAAAFLSDFAGSAAWAHMDIAGTAWADQEPWTPKGGTGEGSGTVAALAEFVSRRGTQQANG